MKTLEREASTGQVVATAMFAAPCEVCRIIVTPGTPISPKRGRFTHDGCTHGAGHGHGIRPGCPNPDKRGFYSRQAAYGLVTPGGSAYKCVCGAWHRTRRPAHDPKPLPAPAPAVLRSA